MADPVPIPEGKIIVAFYVVLDPDFDTYCISGRVDANTFYVSIYDDEARAHDLLTLESFDYEYRGMFRAEAAKTEDDPCRYLAKRLPPLPDGEHWRRPDYVESRRTK